MATTGTHHFYKTCTISEKHGCQTREVEGLVEHSYERATQEEVEECRLLPEYILSTYHTHFTHISMEIMPYFDARTHCYEACYTGTILLNFPLIRYQD